MTAATLQLGDRVRFAHEHDGGPVHRIVAIDHDGMVDLNDMVGWFAPHLFERAGPKITEPEYSKRLVTVTLSAEAWAALLTKMNGRPFIKHGAIATYVAARNQLNEQVQAASAQTAEA